MDQPGLFDCSNPDRAEMVIHLSWNNGPFDQAGVQIVVTVGGREVCRYGQSANNIELDFTDVMHVALREANRLVLGHRVTNSHIRRGRVVFGPLSLRTWDLDDGLDASESS